MEGVYPDLSIVDNRETGDVVRGGLSVGLLFVLLAAASIYIKRLM
jgi:hypothetical protein